MTLVILFVIIGCNKADQKGMTFEKLNLKEQKELIQKIANDNDWKLIAKANSDFMIKLVSSNIDITKVNIENQDAFLKEIGIDKSVYLETVSKVKIAANRLLKKYDIIKLSNQAGNCLSCKETEITKMNQLKKTVVKFKNNPAAFRKTSQLLSRSFTNETLARSVQSDVESSESGGGNWCCPFAFYACCAVSSGTISAFPVYLACCYICGVEFCCDDWPGK